MNKQAIEGITKAIHGTDGSNKMFEKAIEKITGEPMPTRDEPEPEHEITKAEIDRLAPNPFVPTRRTHATVKVMRSFDYCHFESSTTLEGEHITLCEIDEERKNCQRLCDKAVAQYQKAKQEAIKQTGGSYEIQVLRKEVLEIRNKPESEWTLIDKAKVKTLSDYDHQTRYNYDDDELYHAF